METKNLNTKYCVGLGEILFDVLPSGSQLGGAPANFAYHAGQHGLHSVAVSAVGKDALGETALRILDEKKLKYVMPEVDYPTGTVQVQLDKEGVPTYDIKQGVAWDNIPFTSDIREIAVNAGAVCWGSLAQRSEVSRKTIYTFLDHTPEDCLKIFDINLRQNFYTPEVITESLKRCNVLKINDEELITIGRLFGLSSRFNAAYTKLYKAAIAQNQKFSRFDAVRFLLKAKHDETLASRHFGKKQKRTWYQMRPISVRDKRAMWLAGFSVIISIILIVVNGGRLWNPFR